MIAFLITKNNYVLWHTGYQIIITILVISSTLSLYANLRVATRVYDVEGGVIFSKNSTFVFFDGAAWVPRLRSPSPIMAPGRSTIQQPPFGKFLSLSDSSCLALFYHKNNSILLFFNLHPPPPPPFEKVLDPPLVLWSRVFQYKS